MEFNNLNLIPNSGTDFFLRYVKRRITNNKNFMACITGQTGSGKSYAALSIMEALNGRINHDNVCLTTQAFMERINSGELKKGDVIIWDEAGVNINAKKWQSLANRVVNYLLQTFRNMNLIVIFTLPYLSFLDSDSRKLLHCVFETQSINVSEQTIVLKPLLLQTNQRSGKIYYKYLIVSLNAGSTTQVKGIKLYKINELDLEVYEAFKTEFTKELNEDIQKLIEASMQPKEGSTRERSTDLLNRSVKVMLDQGFNLTEIAENLGFGRRHIQNVAKSLENQALEPA